MNNNSLIRDAYQVLLSTFDGGQIESLLFTSFNFSASFFENNVLPLSAGYSLSEVNGIHAAQINEALATTQITVVCDRSTAPEPKNNYRYGQLAVGLKDAFFHPKIILATGTLENGMPTAELIVGSCNLTLSGWGLNREVAGSCKVGKQQADNLLQLIEWISGIAKADVDRLNIDGGEVKEEGVVRESLATIQTFLIDNCQQEVISSPDFILRLPDSKSEKTYLESLISDIKGESDSCRIVSPFWSNREALEKLLATINSKNIDFVPSINAEGKYCFPSDMRDFVNETHFSNGYQGFKNNDRYTHAKYISFVSNDTTHCFIGSANFTKAAMGKMNRGNVEAMLHYKLKETDYINNEFIQLDEKEMNWAEDSESDEQVPKVSPYITNASYDWKTNTFTCVLECSVEAFNDIEKASFKHFPLKFIKQKMGNYLARLKLSVRQPVYQFEIAFNDNHHQQCIYHGLVAQWNAEDDQLIYSPKPQLSKIMDDLIALDPTQGPAGSGGSKSSISEEGEEEDQEERAFDFFSIYQAFYKQRKYFTSHPEKDPFKSGTVFSLSVMFRAITLEIDNNRSQSNEMSNEDVIYYFIFLSELASTAKILATTSTIKNDTTLVTKIELAVSELAPSFEKLISESRVLKQFMQTDVVCKNTVAAILKWFKEQVDHTHE